MYLRHLIIIILCNYVQDGKTINNVTNISYIRQVTFTVDAKDIISRHWASSISPRARVYLSIVRKLGFKTTPAYLRYSPHFGFEPYWVSGDWILQQYTKKYWIKGFRNLITPRRATERDVFACGSPCLPYFQEIKDICAFDTRAYWTLWGPQYKAGHWYYYYPYRDFSSYCYYEAVNCRLPEHMKYRFVHVGKCKEDRMVYRQTYFYNLQSSFDATLQMERLSWYFYDIYNRWWWKGYTTTRPLTEPYSTPPGGWGIIGSVFSAISSMLGGFIG